VSGYLWRPVLAGMWKHSQAFDGTYDLDDLMDCHEALDWQQENERRAREALSR